MTDEQRMRVEAHRVREMLAKQIEDIELDGGNIRFFGVAFLVVAMQLHTELEGTDKLAQTMTKIGQKELSRNGVARC